MPTYLLLPHGSDEQMIMLSPLTASPRPGLRRRPAMPQQSPREGGRSVLSGEDDGRGLREQKVICAAVQRCTSQLYCTHTHPSATGQRQLHRFFEKISRQSVANFHEMQNVEISTKSTISSIPSTCRKSECGQVLAIRATLVTKGASAATVLILLAPTKLRQAPET